MHTFITDRNFNSDLRLPVNQKFEIGVNFRIGGVTADVVWFKEHLKNGYCTSQLAEPFSYRRYSPLISKGEQPELTDEGVMNDGELLPYTLNTTFATYLSPQNGIEQEKQGIYHWSDSFKGTAFFILHKWRISGCMRKEYGPFCLASPDRSEWKSLPLCRYLRNRAFCCEYSNLAAIE